MSRISRAAVTALIGVAAISLVACSSGGVGGATGTPAVASTAPSASESVGSSEPSMSAEPSTSPGGSSALNQAFLQFQEIDASKITGGAILTDLGNDQTAVTIGVVAAGVTDPMPASIVPGTCADQGATASPEASMAASPEASASAGASLNATTNLKLSDLTAGSSNTVVATSLDTLLGTPNAIAIQKSAKIHTLVACADITR
jgi:hypothetical protein